MGSLLSSDSLVPYGFDWELYEPGAWRTEYGGVEHSIEFILAPVTAWPDRLRLELESDMMDWEMGHSVYSWREFLGEPSLLAQLSTLAIRSPRPSEQFKLTERERYADEWPRIVLSVGKVREALEWLWKVFRVRLANRAHLTASSDGMQGLEALCTGIAHRFNFLHRLSELPRYPFEEVTSEKGSEESPLDKAQRALNRIAESMAHELFYVMDAKGWNGWEREACSRFLDAVDRARIDFAERARSTETGQAVPQGMQSAEMDRDTPLPSRMRGGYFAPDYAERLRRAFSKDPARFRTRGRSAFKVLRDAAGLSEAEERTVKRWLGYEGSAGGFDDFIERLFSAVGETPPN